MAIVNFNNKGSEEPVTSVERLKVVNSGRL